MKKMNTVRNKAYAKRHWLETRYPVTTYIPQKVKYGKNKDKPKDSIMEVMPYTEGEGVVNVYNYKRKMVEPYKMITDSGHVISFECDDSKIAWWLSEWEGGNGRMYVSLGNDGPFQLSLLNYWSHAYDALVNGGEMPKSEILIESVEQMNELIDLVAAGKLEVHHEGWTEMPPSNNHIDRLRLQLTVSHDLQHSVAKVKKEETKLSHIGKAVLDSPTLVSEEGEFVQCLGDMQTVSKVLAEPNVKTVDAWVTFPDGMFIKLVDYLKFAGML